MKSLAQTQFNSNAQPLVLGGFSIRQDDEGRYSLADLHKASGNLAKHKPSNFLRVEQTQDLINEIEQGSNISFGDLDQCSNMRSAVKVINGGNSRGTYAVKEMVYAYAMWISAKFHLQVIRAYDALVMQWQISERQNISPEQQALLHEIVARRSGGERKVFAEMWARHNRHFKIPRYSELLTVHFPEAVHYLETMELKAKTVKQEVKSLPYPQEVMQIAKQISHEFKGGQFKNWLVTENNGLLSIQALAHGYYPTIDIAEFTKRFDNLLDLLYGSDTLRVGRHFLAERKQAKF